MKIESRITGNSLNLLVGQKSKTLKHNKLLKKCLGGLQ